LISMTFLCQCTALLACRFIAPAKPVLDTRLPPCMCPLVFFLRAPVPLLHRLVPFARLVLLFAAGFFAAGFLEGRLWAVEPVSLTARLRGDLPPRTGTCPQVLSVVALEIC
jgi:hypothetical protein